MLLTAVSATSWGSCDRVHWTVSIYIHATASTIIPQFKIDGICFFVKRISLTKIFLRHCLWLSTRHLVRFISYFRIRLLNGLNFITRLFSCACGAILCTFAAVLEQRPMQHYPIRTSDTCYCLVTTRCLFQRGVSESLHVSGWCVRGKWCCCEGGRTITTWRWAVTQTIVFTSSTTH